MIRRGLRRWAKPLRFSHICIYFIFVEKAVVFQTFYRLFFSKDNNFFENSNCFLRENPLLFSIKAHLLPIVALHYKPVSPVFLIRAGLMYLPVKAAFYAGNPSLSRKNSSIC